MKLTDSEVSWLAASVDFEGSILMYPSSSPGANNVRCNVTVLTNTDFRLIQHASFLLDKSNITHRVVPLSNSKRWKPQWKFAWRVEIYRVDDTKEFLSIIRHSLKAKSEQCELALEFLGRRSSTTKVKTTEYEWSLARRCQELNKRGISESVETIRRASNKKKK